MTHDVHSGSSRESTDQESLPLVGGALAERMGIEVRPASVDAAQWTATMPVAGNTQPFGLLHGGASAVLAESLGSLVALSLCPPGGTAVGVDLNITHHRAVRDGTVRATADVLYAGTSTATVGVEIRDQADRRVASARLTCRLFPPRGGVGGSTRTRGAGPEPG